MSAGYHKSSNSSDKIHQRCITKNLEPSIELDNFNNIYLMYSATRIFLIIVSSISFWIFILTYVQLIHYSTKVGKKIVSLHSQEFKFILVRGSVNLSSETLFFRYFLNSTHFIPTRPKKTKCFFPVRYWYTCHVDENVFFSCFFFVRSFPSLLFHMRCPTEDHISVVLSYYSNVTSGVPDFVGFE